MADPQPPAAPPPPTCHVCGEEAETGWQRHATQAEYDAMATSPLRPIDGVLLIAVHACGDHELPPICDGHPAPEPQPCPVCDARPGASCTKANGEQRRHHKRRLAQDAALQPAVCRHAHRPDCPGYGGCQCSPNDDPPQRTPYAPPPTVSRADQAAALQKLHEAELAWYSRLLIEAGNDPHEAARLARAAFGEHMDAALSGQPLPEPTLPPVRDVDVR
jgi:hypothetical protein